MEKTKKTTNFTHGAAILGFAGLIVKVIGAVYRIPLANILDKGLGYYEVAYPIYSGLLVISSAGIPTAISKLVSERIALGDAIGAKKVFSSALKVLLLIGIITSVLLLALAVPIAKMADQEPAKLSLIALAPALFFVSIMCAYRGYLQGMQCMTGTAISQLIEQFIKLLVGFSLAALLMKRYPKHPEYAAMGALIGVTISEFAALIFIALYYNIRLRRGTLSICIGRNAADSAAPSNEIIKKLLVIAIPITIGASIMPITATADTLFITRILKERAISAGIDADIAKESAQTAFRVLRGYVTPLINMPAVLTLALSMSLVPAISQAVTKREWRNVNSASRTGIKLALLIGAPCAAGLFVLGGPIMSMLYDAVRSDREIYIQAQQVMYIAAIGVLFLSLVQTLTGIIQGIGKPRVPVYFLAVGGAVKIISMLVLMKFTNLGILGAAISTVLCYAIAGIGDTVYVIRKTRMSISYSDTFIKPILSSVVMGVFVHLVFGIFKSLGHPTIGTMLAIIVGIAVYAVSMILSRPFAASDLEYLPKRRLFAKIFRID